MCVLDALTPVDPSTGRAWSPAVSSLSPRDLPAAAAAAAAVAAVAVPLFFSAVAVLRPSLLGSTRPPSPPPSFPFGLSISRVPSYLIPWCTERGRGVGGAEQSEEVECREKEGGEGGAHVYRLMVKIVQ